MRFRWGKAWAAAGVVAAIVGATLVAGVSSAQAAGPLEISSPTGTITTRYGILFAGTNASDTSTPVTFESLTSVSTTPICTATFSSGSYFSCTANLENGTYSIYATQGGANTSETEVITVDAPAVPSITSPTNGDVFTTNTVTFHGDGPGPHGTLNVTDNRGTNGTTFCTGVYSGPTWSCTATISQPGTYEAVANQGDGPGNTVTFTVDTAPTAPVIDSPGQNDVVFTQTPLISGTADANTDVAVTFAAGGNVCETRSNGTGQWSCAPASLQFGSSYTILATATTAGGSAHSALRNFSVQRQIVAPTITAPANGKPINTQTPQITGTGTVGDTITVTDSVEGEVCSGVTPTASGWSCTLTKALRDGDHTLTATGSAGSGSSTFAVDTVAPAAPVISTPKDGDVFKSRTISLAGTAEADSTVKVSDGASTICSPTANGQGNWQCSATLGSDNEFTLRATATDAAGNVSLESNRVTITIDTVAPAKPVITAPADGTSIQDTSPTITGTAERNATVVVKEGTTTICSTSASTAGAWQCDPTTPFAEGPHTLSAVATDAAGNDSPAATSTFTVDTIAPDAPVIERPADGTSTNDTTPTVSGTAEANARVNVVDESGDAVCTNVVATGGTWTCDSAVTFAAGEHRLTATATDAAGNVSDPSDTTTFTIDLTPPSAPTIDIPANGDVTADSTPTLHGSADDGDVVTVTDQTDRVLCSATAVGGAWSCDSVALDDGDYTVVPTAEDPAGNTTAGAAVTFTIDTVPPVPPVITAPADGTTINTPKPELSGTSEEGTTITVRDADDDVVCADAPVSSDGRWSCTSDRTYQDGPLTFTPTATDAAGHTRVGDPVSVTLDTAAPTAPTITAPVDGTVTAETSLQVAGTADDADTVRVEDASGATVCGPVTPTDGVWTCGDQDFAEGTYTLTAIASDAGGNEANSAPVSFEVDVTAPAAPRGVTCVEAANGTATCSGTDAPARGTVVVRDAADRTICEQVASSTGAWSCTTDAPVPEYPVVVQYRDAAGNESQTTALPIPPQITAPTDGTLTNDPRPRISGTALAADGSVVDVRDEHGTLVCQATATGGTWACTPTAPLAEGDPTLRASIADADGNSFAGRPVEVVVDTVAPAAPTGSCVRTANGTATCTGRAEPRATVVLYGPNGAAVCETTASASGAWACTTTVAVTASSLEARAIDAAGNVSDPGTLAVSDATGPGGPGTGGPGTGGPGTGLPGTGVGSGGAGGLGGSGLADATGSRHGGRRDAALAYTGSEGTGSLVVAALLLVGAGGVMRLRRRRRAR